MFTPPDHPALHRPRQAARCTAAPEKRYDGTTHLENLFLCGNDQGLVGIVGTMLSGITHRRNRHADAER